MVEATIGHLPLGAERINKTLPQRPALLWYFTTPGQRVALSRATCQLMFFLKLQGKPTRKSAKSCGTGPRDHQKPPCLHEWQQHSASACAGTHQDRIAIPVPNKSPTSIEHEQTKPCILHLGICLYSGSAHPQPSCDTGFFTSTPSDW